MIEWIAWRISVHKRQRAFCGITMVPKKKKTPEGFTNLSRSLGVYGSIGFLLVFLLSRVLADMWPPSGEITRFSRDRRIAATSYSTNETIVYEREPFRLLWKFPKALCAFEVSHDGDTVVAATYLLPLNAGADDVVLTFILRGKVIREITVKQLVGSPSTLQRITPEPGGLCVPAGNTDFLSWGRGVVGIDPNGFVLVDTAVGFFVFDAHTAKCVFPPNNQIDPP
jgi:hypothetical protein